MDAHLYCWFKRGRGFNSRVAARSGGYGRLCAGYDRGGGLMRDQVAAANSASCGAPGWSMRSSGARRRWNGTECLRALLWFAARRGGSGRLCGERDFCEVLAGKEAEARPPEVLAGENEVGRRAEDEGSPPEVLAGKEAETRPPEVFAGKKEANLT